MSLRHRGTTVCASILCLAIALLAINTLLGSVTNTQFVVNTTTDNTEDPINFQDDVLTLREAVILANQTPGDDTIVLEPRPYTLTRQGQDDDASHGDLDVTDFGGRLRVVVLGEGGAAVDANGLSDRVFDVHPGAWLALESITVEGGETVPSGNGGGIRCNQATLSLNDSSVEGNVANAPPGPARAFGGGIASQDCDTTLVFTAVQSNEAGSASSAGGKGGGISHFGPGQLRIVDSLIFDNFATFGAGILASGPGNVTIENTEISENRIWDEGPGVGGGRGGGIRGEGAHGQDLHLTIDRCDILDNVADSSGGGISFADGFLTVTHTNILRNGSLRGGFFGAGIACEDATIVGVPAHVFLEESTISNNGSIDDNAGGGIAILQDCTVDIVRSTISGNKSHRGAGIHMSADPPHTLRIEDSTIAFNTAGDTGGGIYLDASPGVPADRVTLRNTIVGRNSPEDLDHTGESRLAIVGRNLVQRIDDTSWLDGDTSILLLGLDPRLGPLRDNGGDTLTHLPLPGSPAIDGGSCSGGQFFGDTGECADDQREVCRPVFVPTARARRFDGGCDIGSVEYTEEDLDALGEVQVPIRWCVLEGTSATGPSGDPNQVAIARLLGANDVLVGGSDTRLYLRSGANHQHAQVQVLQHQAQNGQPGDVYVNLEGAAPDLHEFFELLNECRISWSDLPGGLTAVLIRRFVDRDGNQLPLAGIGGRAIEGDCPSQLSAGRVMVVDGGPLTSVQNGQSCSLELTEARLGKFLAHEAGHSFSLRHGHGLDTSGDHNIDDVGDESWEPLGLNLMEYGEGPNGPGTVLGRLQTFQARQNALECIPGSEPEGIVPLIADLKATRLEEQVDPGRIKIVSLGIVLNPDGTSTLLAESLKSPLSLELDTAAAARTQGPVGGAIYRFFADLDHDPTTGGTILGDDCFAGLTGIELIGEIDVPAASLVESSVKVFENGAFVEKPGAVSGVTNLNVGVAQFCSGFELDDPLVGASVQLRIPNDTLTDAGWVYGGQILLTVIAETGQSCQERNVVPPGGPAPILGPPTPSLPTCRIEPSSLAPGGELSVSVTGFSQSAQLPATLGDQVLGFIETDPETGGGDVQSTMPSGVPAGRHLVQVRQPDTALQALCVADVLDAPPQVCCHDVTVTLPPETCAAEVSVDCGSADPNGDPITLGQEPPGPYLAGTTLVTLTATGAHGESSSCSARITVLDATHCEDGNPCTDDLCGPSGACLHAPASGRSCSDGDDCTSDDRCDAEGRCVGGPLSTTDRSYFSTASQQFLDGVTARDGDVFQAGTCVGGIAPVARPLVPADIGVDALDVEHGEILFSVRELGGVRHPGGYLVLRPEDVYSFDVASGEILTVLSWRSLGIDLPNVVALDRLGDGSFAFAVATTRGVRHAGGFTVLRPQNVYRFDPTTRAISLLLDGASHGLTELDGLDVHPDGLISISTTTNVLVHGVLLKQQNAYELAPDGRVTLSLDGGRLGLQSLDDFTLEVAME